MNTSTQEISCSVTPHLSTCRLQFPPVVAHTNRPTDDGLRLSCLLWSYILTATIISFLSTLKCLYLGQSCADYFVLNADFFSVVTYCNNWLCVKTYVLTVVVLYVKSQRLASKSLSSRRDVLLNHISIRWMNVVTDEKVFNRISTLYSTRSNKNTSKRNDTGQEQQTGHSPDNYQWMPFAADGAV